MKSPILQNTRAARDLETSCCQDSVIRVKTDVATPLLQMAGPELALYRLALHRQPHPHQLLQAQEHTSQLRSEAHVAPWCDSPDTYISGSRIHIGAKHFLAPNPLHSFFLASFCLFCNGY